MSPLERLIAERERDNRIANWLTALLLILVGGAVLAVVLFYHPERAHAATVTTSSIPCSAPRGWNRYKTQTARERPKLREVVKFLRDGKVRPCRAQAAFYNHVDVCKSTLRGYSSDDDIHIYGVNTGAKRFDGWGSAGHYSDNSVYVWAKFEYSYGYVVLVKGRCSGGDYASDWFE